MNRLNTAILGDFFIDTRFALSLADEKDAEKLMYCVFADGRTACRVNLCFMSDLTTDEKHTHVESIELTSANRTQAERILSELINDKQRVSEILSELDSKHYCKLTEINAEIENDKLKAFLFNDEFSPNINEITICFKISDLVHKEIHANGYDSINFRSIYDTVYYPQGAAAISTESMAHLHYAMQKTDVFIIADSSFYSSFTDEQLELLKPYIKSIPTVAFNSESDLLIDILEDVAKCDEMKKEYLKNTKKIKCRNTNRMLKKINVGNVFCDEDGSIMTIGCTSGDDGNDMELYNKLLAFSLGLVAEKFNSWVSHSVLPEIRFTKKHIEKITELSDNKEQVIEFLKSDKPLIHANGGITIKNHGKYKFKETCILAAGLYKYIDAAIDGADMSETDKFYLYNKLLHNLDSYAFFDGHKLLNRKIFVEIAEDVRKCGKEDIITELAKHTVDYFTFNM